MPSSLANGSTREPFPSVLCIAGLDPSGGAGLLADERACAAFGAHMLGVATAVVVQNTRGVKLVDAVAPEIVAAQIETLLEDIQPAAIKLGMIPGIATATVIQERLQPLRDKVPIVIDPVFGPSTGPVFNDNATVQFLAGQLLSLATLITPNLDEAWRLGAGTARNMDEMAKVCLALRERTGAGHVLLKGGHMETEDPELANLSVDLLFDGSRFLELRALREKGYEVRGTGCGLASAIAAQLASGSNVIEAARAAKVWLTQQIRDARAVGGGRRVTTG
jgi:hydroxymethylpyrimidine/phosphomethylpyrimidine kinase